MVILGEILICEVDYSSLFRKIEILLKLLLCKMNNDPC